MKPFPRAFLVLLIICLAVGSALSYWILIRPSFTSLGQNAQFAFRVYPEFFHVAAGGGSNITTFVQRSAGFSGPVRIEVVNPPSWVIYIPLTLNATDTNSTFAVGASKNAPVTELNLTVRASSAGSVDQVATIDMKVVGVQPVTSNIGSGVVYDTTKVLDADTMKALSAYQNGTFTFSTVTPQLRNLARGDVMIIPPSATSLANDGLMRLVVTAAQEGSNFVVETRQATLFDEFQTLDIGTESAGSANGTYTGQSISGLGGSQAKAPSSASFDLKPALNIDPWITLFDASVSFSAGDIGNGATFSGYGGLTAKLAPSIHIHMCDYIIPCLTMLKLHLNFLIGATLSLKGNAGSQLNWHGTLQNLAGPVKISLLDDLLWLNFDVTLDGIAYGPLNQDIDGTWSLSYSVEMGPTWDDDNGWSWYQVNNGPSMDKNLQISLGSGSNTKLGIGPKVDAGINGSIIIASAGAQASLAAFFTLLLQSQVPKPSDKPASWWVDWEIDGLFDLSFYVSISLVHTWSLDICIPHSCVPGAIYGPTLLFDGWPLTPLVKITSPHDGDTLDYNTLLFLPSFTATATGEDGDQCETSPPQNLVWSDEYGKIGNGCSVKGVKLTPDGSHTITFTVTTSAGASSSDTVTVNVNTPRPDVYITQPVNNQNFMVGDPVTLEGYGVIHTTNYPCNQPTGRLDFSIWLTAIVTSQPESGGLYCAASYTFDKAGTYYIRLVARDNSGKIIGFSRLVKINVLAPSQGTNLPPEVDITSPHYLQSFLYLNYQVDLEGDIFDYEGDPMGTYTWSYAPMSMTQSPVTIATGTLPSSCTQGSPCHVSATLNTNDYCTSHPTGGEIAILLEATETSPAQTGKGEPVLIHLFCEQVASIGPIISASPTGTTPSLGVATVTYSKFHVSRRSLV